MSCGGKALPIRVQLRIQAATIAASAMSGYPDAGNNGAVRTQVFSSVAREAFEFITKDFDMAGFEKQAETASGPKARMAFLRSPAVDLVCELSVEPETDIPELRSTDVRGLLTHYYKFVDAGPTHSCIVRELAQHGLRFGMTEHEIAHWVAHGQQTDQENFTTGEIDVP